MEVEPTTQSISELLQDAIQNAMSYPEFRLLVSGLAKQHGTTGPEQTEAYKHYTELNDRRMHRWDKTLRIPEEYQQTIRDYNQEVYWLVITESWCGDAAPSLPVMNRISQINDRISLRIILRSDYPQIMDLFLTDGKQSIPKLIAISADALSVLGTWGPLPSEAMEIATAYKAEHGTLTADFKEDLQQWFNQDKGKNILKDLLGLLALKEISDGA
jgi:hypothetical protein